jgi:DNA mismatch repair protein MutL
MGRIQVLSTDVVNKIAAGEVIERPASAVKELVENALDAGARDVRVDLEDWGRKLVRVQDDGHGIEEADLPLAFAPHATSKLREADDLFRVATFGFRGEALASIGSVAQVRLLSRPKGKEARELEVEYGRIGEVRPAAGAPGTLIEVRTLFGNVPVRRKFLRSVQVETEHVADVLARFAVAHPEVRFEFRVEGERRFAVAPGERRDRIAAFFDPDTASALKEVEAPDFHAWIAPPQFSRVNAKGLWFFLNGRFIRDRVLMKAVGEAYRELVPHGRYPVGFVFLTLPPEDVDVNVHPTKIEVRFRNVWRLHDRLAALLRERLLEGSMDHRLTPAHLSAHAEGTGTGPAAAVEAPVSGREVVDFFSREPELRLAGPATALPAAAPLITTGRRVFQLHNRYLVEEVEDGLRIVDQHALHERVMLEEFRKQFARAAVARQKLLLPAVVTLGRERRRRLDQHRELLESFGVEVEDFGKDAVAVRAVPALVAEHDPATLLEDFLDLAQDSDPGVPLLEHALEFMACRAAVKFGKKLSDEEIARLLQDAAAIDFSATCAHGRPTGIKLTLQDLERFFHR